MLHEYLRKFDVAELPWDLKKREGEKERNQNIFLHCKHISKNLCRLRDNYMKYGTAREAREIAELKTTMRHIYAICVQIKLRQKRKQTLGSAVRRMKT
jgi:hypothetical protein